MIWRIFRKTLQRDLSIVQENEQFILKSEEFNALSDYQEVKGKVIEILNSVNAVALIFLQSREKLNCKISQLREDGVEILFLESHVAGYGRSYARLSRDLKCIIQFEIVIN